ncbi:sugar transferase [Ruminococcus sp. 5_1_39BFAA]|uniref:sugar transferase n=1 Tax=Ruminococcus sp. 5_1_39BFAA TaxID=457412 RepID=UPI00356A987F
MSIDKKKIIGISAAVLGAAFVGMSILARKKKPSSIYEDDKEHKNPFEGKKVVLIKDENDKENADGVKGHLEAIGEVDYNPGFYEKHVKRVIDVVLSFGGLVTLSPFFTIIALAIKIEDPGPVLFTQKRVGQNKRYFKLHKFRSMKMSTPHDVPTHQLENPEQYITKVGKFLRAHSLDELPQIWDIFIGNMSVIGPRPGLWNQDLLTAERDKYGANDVKPGLTGWAQINGRDELEILDKAKLDGEYVKKMGLGMDIKCFLGSIHVFGKDESVVEGGTGEMKKKNVGRHYTDGKSDDELIGHIGFGEPVEADKDGHKRVLITGVDSYIGESFRAYAVEYYPDNFTIDAVDMIDSAWRDMDFSPYDVVFHVAGIAHADVGNVSDEVKEKYYAVNTDLAIETANKAKADGVKQFVFMSSAIVYGDSAPYGKRKRITADTKPKPANFYGDSKWQADKGVRKLADNSFIVTVLRPPMIYGKNSKGNYPTLAKMAKKLSIFPDVQNERSMLYIENLCEFLCQVMIRGESGIFWPQNAEYTRTSELVKIIGEVSGHNVRVSKRWNWVVGLASRIPGKVSGLANKAFGNMIYEQNMSQYDFKYQKVSLKESIKRTEG